MAASHIASHKLFRRLVGLIALDTLLFGASNAGEAPSWLIMAGFLALCATFYYVIYGLIKGLALYGLVLKRQKTLSLYATIVLSVLLALQSVGELGSRDLLVLLPLTLIGWFYNAYARAGRA